MIYRAAILSTILLAAMGFTIPAYAAGPPVYLKASVEMVVSNTQPTVPAVSIPAGTPKAQASETGREWLKSAPAFCQSKPYGNLTPEQMESCNEAAFRYQASLGQVYKPTPTQAQHHHVPAGGQALVCDYPDQKLDCEMYIAGFTDTVNMVMVDGGSTKTLCGDTDTSDLLAEFEQEARKNPEADTDTVLFQMLKTNHMCASKKVQIYNPTSAGNLIDLCHTGDTGFNLCSQYQWGFLQSLFLMSEQTKIPILCGNMSIVDGSIMMLNNELQADFRLRHKPAVWLMLGALQKKLPCPK